MDYNSLWAIALPYIVIFGIFYLILIVPQRRRQKKIMEMLDGLKEGDKIVTIGGIIGVITHLDDNEISIETGLDNTKMKILRTAIRSVENIEESEK